MNKNEVLQKSREQKEDEGVIYANNRGRSTGVIGFCSLFIVVVMFNFFTGQSNHVPFALFWAYGAAEAYGKYRITHGRGLLVTVIFAAIASVCFLACHVLVTLHIGI